MPVFKVFPDSMDSPAEVGTPMDVRGPIAQHRDIAVGHIVIACSRTAIARETLMYSRRSPMLAKSDAKSERPRTLVWRPAGKKSLCLVLMHTVFEKYSPHAQFAKNGRTSDWPHKEIFDLTLRKRSCSTASPRFPFAEASIAKKGIGGHPSQKSFLIPSRYAER